MGSAGKITLLAAYGSVGGWTIAKLGRFWERAGEYRTSTAWYALTSGLRCVLEYRFVLLPVFWKKAHQPVLRCRVGTIVVPHAQNPVTRPQAVSSA